MREEYSLKIERGHVSNNVQGLQAITWDLFLWGLKEGGGGWLLRAIVGTVSILIDILDNIFTFPTRHVPSHNAFDFNHTYT